MNVVTEQKTTVQRYNVGKQWKNALKLYNRTKLIPKSAEILTATEQSSCYPLKLHDLFI
jgi:hypothetical protein